ncbi:MAG: PEGA domain-containing protein, partial [Myxococcota bacterium]
LDTLRQSQTNGFLRWDEEELDTKVYGRSHSSSTYDTISPASDVGEPLPDIVYKDAPKQVAPVGADLLDVVELAAGFDDLDDPTMEFDRDEHMSALTGIGPPTPTPAPAPKPPPPSVAPVPAPPPPSSGPDLFGASPASSRPMAIQPPPQPAPKSNGVVIGLLVALIVLLVAGIVVVLVAPSLLTPADSAITFKVSNAESVTIAIDNEVVHEGLATQDIVVDDVGPGDREITISADGFETLTDNLTVKSGKKYVLPIQLKAKAPAVASNVSGVALKATPGDALVFVDGNRLTASLPLEHKLPPGTHEVKFTKEGFLEQVRKVEVKAGQMIPVEVTLRPATIVLEVRAEPSSAVVTVLEIAKEGDTKGRKVKSGKGTVTIKDLDATKLFRIVAEADEHTSFGQEFKPGADPSSTVVAKLKPEEAVADNGKATESQPGETRDNLLAKREEARKKREREARKRKEEEERKAAAKKAEEDRKRREAANDKAPPETPKPEKTGPGFLNIASKPAAQVTIDGASVGWTPVINHKVSPGSHSVVLVNDKEGIRKTYRVNIKSGQTRSIMNLPKK